jgi:hypothetical protein
MFDGSGARSSNRPRIGCKPLPSNVAVGENEDRRAGFLFSQYSVVTRPPPSGDAVRYRIVVRVAGCWSGASLVVPEPAGMSAACRIVGAIASATQKNPARKGRVSE